MGRINGSEFKTVYVFSKPEWTALLTRKDSAIKSVGDLKDKGATAVPAPVAITGRSGHQKYVQEGTCGHRFRGLERKLGRYRRL